MMMKDEISPHPPPNPPPPHPTPRGPSGPLGGAFGAPTPSSRLVGTPSRRFIDVFHSVNDSRKIPCFAPVGHKLRTPRFQSLNPSFQNSNPSLQSSNPLFSTPSLMCSRPESSNLVCSIKPIEQKTSTKTPSSHLPSGSWGNPEFVQGSRIGALPGQNWPRVPGFRPCQARIGLGFEDLGPASPQLA